MNGVYSMKNKYFVLTVLFILTASLAFSSCSKKPSTLEEYAKNNTDITEKISDSGDDSKSSDVRVSIKGNDVIYDYDLSLTEGFTEDIAEEKDVKKSLSKSLDKMEDSFTDVASSIEKATGISGIHVIVNYNFKDTNIISKTFPEKEE
jgi:uncharacterized lipoprotein YajG